MPLSKPSYGVGGWGPVVDALIDWYNANESGFVAADGSITNAKVSSTAAISADKLADGTSNKVLTAAERTKLAGIAASATANASDAALRDRATHTGLQSAATVSDFVEAVQDAVGAMVVAGSNVTVNYDDAAGSLTISSTGGGSSSADAETIRDTIAASLIGTGNISVVVNDAADTITFSTTATVNSTDAQLRDRSTHTGTQSADTITDGTNNKAFTSAEKTKLSTVAGGATYNSSDSFLLSRTNHTGTQLSSTISDFNEAAQDAVSTMLAAGTNVSLSYNDAANTLTITSTGADAEAIRDAIGLAMVGVGVVSVVANDAADTITISSTATVNSPDATLLDRANHTGVQSISTVSGLQTALDAKATFYVVHNTLTSTSYTFVLADASRLTEANSASAQTYTVPPNSSVAFPVGTVLEVVRHGAGSLTIAAGAGVTIRTPSTLTARVQYSTIALRQRAANEWVASGDLT